MLMLLLLLLLFAAAAAAAAASLLLLLPVACGRKDISARHALRDALMAYSCRSEWTRLASFPLCTNL